MRAADKLSGAHSASRSVRLPGPVVRFAKRTVTSVSGRKVGFEMLNRNISTAESP